MEKMFEGSEFNQDISKWDTKNVKNMTCMFAESKFNQDISQWNTFNVEKLHTIFTDSDFSQDISQWDVSNVKEMNNIFKNCPAPIPYWFKISDFQERKISIKHYHLNLLINKLNLISPAQNVELKRHKL